MLNVDFLVFQCFGGIQLLAVAMISHGSTGLNAKLPTLFAQVLRVLNRVEVASFNVIKEDVAVGRDAIFQASLAATGKGDELRVRAPSQLFNTAEGLHGALKGLAIEDVELLTRFEIDDEGMLDALHIVVPMAIHQVVHDATGSFGKVFRILLDDFIEVDALQEDGFLAIRSEEEALDLAVGLGHLLAVLAVQAHLPDLTFPEESDGFVVQPPHIGLVLGIGCQLSLLAAVSIHHPKNLVALVLRHAVVAHLEGNVLSVWRGLIATNAAHCPKCLGRHEVAIKLNGLFLYVNLVVFLLRTARHE